MLTYNLTQIWLHAHVGAELRSRFNLPPSGVEEGGNEGGEADPDPSVAAAGAVNTSTAGGAGAASNQGGKGSSLKLRPKWVLPRGAYLVQVLVLSFCVQPWLEGLSTCPRHGACREVLRAYFEGTCVFSLYDVSLTVGRKNGAGGWRHNRCILFETECCCPVA